MSEGVQAVLTKILEKFYNHHNSKFDAHYSEGQGALIVPYDYPLSPQYVVAKIPEHQIVIMSMTGVNINFK